MDIKSAMLTDGQYHIMVTLHDTGEYFYIREVSSFQEPTISKGYDYLKEAMEKFWAKVRDWREIGYMIVGMA